MSSDHAVTLSEAKGPKPHQRHAYRFVILAQNSANSSTRLGGLV
jgi:hypothetical protein